MKIFLLTPPFDLIKKGYSSKLSIKRGHMPPLGIGYLAAVLQQEGHEVNLLDSCAMGLDYSSILKEICAYKPDIVGISTLIAFSKEAYALAGYIKQQLQTTIVMGGPHPSSFPENVFEDSPDVDIVVLGEGEATIVNLIKALEGRKDLSAVEGIWWKDSSGNIIKNPLPKFKNNLDEIPFPARHLYRNELYIPLPNYSKRLPATNMITSRGCPYARCTFCFQGGKYACPYRRRSPRNVIEEIKYLTKSFGFKEIIFWDDNFAVNMNWIVELCDLIREEQLDITWSCFGRVDTVTRPMLEKMEKAGCFSILFGFESGNQDILEKLNKGTTLEQARNAVKWAHLAGIEVRGTFMLSLPGEDPARGKKTIDFALELDLDSVSFFPFHPMKGTKLYPIAEAEGKELKYPEQGLHSVTYVADGYSSAGEVAQMIKKGYISFYLRPHYLLKCIKKIKSFSDIKRYLSGVKLLLGIIPRNI